MTYAGKTTFNLGLFVFLLSALCTIGFCQGCPTIELETPSGMTTTGDTFLPRAIVKSAIAVGDLKYDWTISGGFIEKGSGTETLVVHTLREDDEEVIDVKVTISGLPSVCANTASGHVYVAPRLRCGLPVDEFSTPSANEVKARVDNIFIQLNNNPNSVAYFVMEFSESETVQDRRLRITRILNAIKSRKYDLSKVIFLISKGDRLTSTIVTILPLSEDMGERINKSDLIYGQNMKQKLPTLFQNK